MDDFNKGFTSFTSIKPYSALSPSIKGGNKSNNENELNPQMNLNIKSPSKKQLPTKNFMSPTVSAAIKASVPKKKILGERNETLDTVEQSSLLRSVSFGSNSVRSSVVDSDDDVEKDFVGESCLQPYDPVKNYLSPRPKFLRYDPDRRRKILNLQENDDDRVKISTYFYADNGGIPSSGLQLELGSSASSDAQDAQDVKNEEDEDENGEECEGEDEDEDEERVEFGEDGCFRLKGFIKCVFVVIALFFTTQAICSMNSPSPSQTLESAWGVDDWNNRVYGLNLSEVGYGVIRETDLLVGDVYGVYETVEKFVEVQDAKTDDSVPQDEVENDDSNVIQDYAFQEQEIKASKAIEIGYVEDGTNQNFNQDGLIQEDDSDANENNPKLTNEVKFKLANDITDGAEDEIDDIKANDVLIKLTSFDPTIAVLIGSVIILVSFGIIYRSKGKKSSASVTTSVEEEEFKDLEPYTNPQSITQQKEEEEPFLTSAPTSKVNIPSVELLGEFVFGEEITSSISAQNYSSSSLIQTTVVSSNQTKSSHMEMSTGDSHTVKKQRRKIAEVVTPSPVRRSSRLKSKSLMSP